MVQIYKIMLKVALLCLGIIAISLLFLCIGILFGRRHTFRSQHVGQSAALRKQGIHCVQSMDAMERKTLRTREHALERREERTTD